MMTSKSSITSTLRRWLAPLACATLLAACGGGGGSPGSSSNGTAPSRAASIVLIAGASTIPSSGVDGTEVTLTAIVRDSNNNVLKDEKVDFQASSGNISSNNRVTNADGAVVEKLNVKDSDKPREITITASTKTVTSNAVKVTVVAAMPTLTLTTDSGTLSSSGAAGSEVTVTALVKDSNNTVVPNTKVTLSADSGSLSLTNRVTDSKGMVTEKLSTGGDPTSRRITVTAKVDNAPNVFSNTVVTVAGTRLSVNTSSTVNVGSSSDVTVKLVDSVGNALTGQTVTFSSLKNNLLTVKDGKPAVTNAAGQVILNYTASNGGSDTITVKALGETTSAVINVSSANFYIKAVNDDKAANDPTNVKTVGNIRVCHKVFAHADVAGTAQKGTVSISTSRGNIYSNSDCSSLQNGAIALTNGEATAYVTATGPGVATLGATITDENGVTGASAQGTLEFVAPLLSSATIILQADPAVLGVNAVGATGSQSTLRAIVLDGTVQNNPVKNARVTFSIQSDPSGGTLTQPSEVFTGSDGSASVSYIAGTTATATDGVVIQARLSGASTAFATVRLTVAQKALFISAGTGNTIETPGSTTYQVDYAVIVSDAAGNAVSGVKVTGSVLPRYYYKGIMTFVGADGPWAPFNPVRCDNEDTDGNGLYTLVEDTNTNGRLDPGIPVTVTPSTVTDANGRATVSLMYARDRAFWVDVELTIRAQVSGSEARYVGFIHLNGLAKDYSDKKIGPPGQVSPYGYSTLCRDAF